MAIFADRADAGRELAAHLTQWRSSAAIVFGIPRGGVVVAAEVAEALGLPLAAVVVRKLGAPAHEEFAVGAIADDVRVVHDDALRTGYVTPEELSSVEDVEREELRRRTALFGSSVDGIAGRTAIVVDDGVATGATATAACLSLRAHGAAHIVLAAPVAPSTWRPDPGAIDDFVCPHPARSFWAVGEYYDDFTQTGDAEVIALLRAGATGSATDPGR
ncbi:phosphoribosyltransferase [Microbacterium sp. CFBP9034]|uniref:phosphoribosyltransferase n=1 Tax=Microbacterium sp. CFBP9034 TaxID=3096540 RepID=UPI002A6A756C|nr:phosphoribosyltransferase family protein [Microbacterium sp. CFBP9034]MDY0909814.1 phosphoribosyltransferase family protein [Microbacterium sp. CFBP9034]